MNVVYGIHVWDGKGGASPVQSVWSDLSVVLVNATQLSTGSEFDRVYVTQWTLNVPDGRLVIAEFRGGEWRWANKEVFTDVPQSGQRSKAAKGPKAG